MLIHGPPGTGKTKTLMSILRRLFLTKQPATEGTAPTRRFSSLPEVARSRQDKEGFRGNKILMCAPSNAATDELVRRATSAHDGQAVQVLRLGKPGSAHPSVLLHTLERLVEAELSKWQQQRDKMGELLDAKEAKIRKVAQQVADQTRTKDGLLDAASLMRQPVYGTPPRRRSTGTQALIEEADAATQKLTTLTSMHQALLKEIKTLKNDFYQLRKTLEKKERTVRSEVLQRSRLVCCTLSSSALGLIRDSKIKFDTVIVDEAAQCTEPELLIPLQHGCRKLVLVGDPLQLRATVLSQASQRAGLGVSLFERLQQSAKAQGCLMLLKEQYRMHPEICSFPSSQFYNAELVAAAALATRETPAWSSDPALGRPYTFFDVPHGQEKAQSGEGSVCNPAEAAVAVHLFAGLCRAAPSVGFAGRVAFVTPYRRQCDEIRATLRKAFGAKILEAVDVGTVDGFQGQEKDVVIFSCVRAGGKSVGFLKDQRRMNVALTRAKHTLFVVGRSSTLRMEPVWRAMVSAPRCYAACASESTA